MRNAHSASAPEKVTGFIPVDSGLCPDKVHVNDQQEPPNTPVTGIRLPF